MKSSILDYQFKDAKLLELALTHSSCSADNYERLEYLGDALLGAVVAKYLYTNYPTMQAGDMTKCRAKLVNAKVLGDIIIDSGIGNMVRRGKSVRSISHNIYADVYESIVAAIYLDGGDYAGFIYSTLLTSVDDIARIITDNEDYKTKLQDYLARDHRSPKYSLVGSSGQGENAKFNVELYIDDVLIASCTNSSIRKAEQMCAKVACDKLL